LFNKRSPHTSNLKAKVKEDWKGKLIDTQCSWE